MRGSKLKFMASLYGFFDESGKPHQHPIVVFSGFLASWDQWEDLSDEWQRLLRAHNLPAFHFAELKRRHSLVKQFIGAIKANVELGISFAIKVEDFNSLQSHIKRLVGHSADVLAFRAVLMAMTTHVSNDSGNVIHFTCDEDEQRTEEYYKWYKDIKREIPEIASKLISFCVGDDKFIPQLQASDLFAALNRAEASRKLLNEQSSTCELFNELVKPEPRSKLKFKALIVEQSQLAELAAQLEADGVEEIFKMREEGLI